MLAGRTTAQLPPPASTDVVAKFAGVEFTLAQLDALAQERLSRVRNEEYQIRKQVLEKHITKTLLEREAAARNMPLDALLKEVDGKVLPITDEQKQAVYDSQRERYASVPEAQALAQIETNLRQVRLTETRNRFIDSLKSKAGVTISLDPPRVSITEVEGPSRGPKEAPVTIVEFSDFQCPYCSRANATLRQVEARYKDKLRVVFRHFPLQMHKEAAKAAEAATCASEQGKFWEMHDAMFGSPISLQVESLKKKAGEIGLDAGRFAECLDSGKAASVVKRDMADAARYGISSTPVFFVNGRMLAGAKSFDEFVQTIDDELARRRPSSEKR